MDSILEGHDHKSQGSIAHRSEVEQSFISRFFNVYLSQSATFLGMSLSSGAKLFTIILFLLGFYAVSWSASLEEYGEQNEQSPSAKPIAPKYIMILASGIVPFWPIYTVSNKIPLVIRIYSCFYFVLGLTIGCGDFFQKSSAMRVSARFAVLWPLANCWMYFVYKDPSLDWWVPPLWTVVHILWAWQLAQLCWSYNKVLVFGGDGKEKMNVTQLKKRRRKHSKEKRPLVPTEP